MNTRAALQYVSAPTLALLVCGAGLIAPGFAGSQEAENITQAQEATEELDEVTIEGARLSQLRAMIVESEDRFFALYNDLNADDQFDITCEQLQPTGTKLTRRSCFPKAVHEATRDEAIAIHYAMIMGNGARPQRPPATLILATKVQVYKKNMLKILRENPKLHALVQEREKLQGEYDKARRERMKGRLAIVE